MNHVLQSNQILPVFLILYYDVKKNKKQNLNFLHEYFWEKLKI